MKYAAKRSGRWPRADDTRIQCVLKIGAAALIQATHVRSAALAINCSGSCSGTLGVAADALAPFGICAFGEKV